MALPLTLAAGLTILVGLAGIVVPVLPGLILILASVAVWAVALQEPAAWVTLAVSIALGLAGWGLQYLVPTRRLQEAGIPRRTLLVGALGAVLGVFLLPGLGLLVGFVAGVCLAELGRLRSWKQARPAIVAALKAAALSFGIELAAGALIATAFVVGAWRVLS